MESSPVRWSTRDPGATPGSYYNSEKAETARGAIWYPSVGWIAAALNALGRRSRSEFVVEVSDIGVRLGSPPRMRQLAWADIQSVESHIVYPRCSNGPLITLVTVEGDRENLPNTLYPDAASDFPSNRHIDRARAIESALKSGLEAHRAQARPASQNAETGDG